MTICPGEDGGHFSSDAVFKGGWLPLHSPVVFCEAFVGEGVKDHGRQEVAK